MRDVRPASSSCPIAVAPPPAHPSTAGLPRTTFDLEAHRGGRGLRPENTLAAFGHALEIGVSTLELDTGVSEDGVVVVSHERRASSIQCRDTAPAFPGDPEFPYIGKPWRSLTVAQIKTLDCGTRSNATSVPGEPMPTLAEVFALVDAYGANHVQFNIETKLSPYAPDETVDPVTFARTVADTIRAAGVPHRAMVQSFDWRTLVELRRYDPAIRLVSLAPALSTAGIDVAAAPFLGNLPLAARSIGARVFSPSAGLLAARPELLAQAHELGMRVVPWTVNDPAAMAALIDLGADGIISDFPDRLREVMRERGLAVPRAYAAPLDVEARRAA